MNDRVGVNTGTVEVSGAPLYYEVAGLGPPLVLIHEGLADSRMYDDQIGPLAAHYRVVRYDMLGYGRSGNPDRPYMRHEALFGLLQHLGINQTGLLGMSLGGSVAIEFTLAYPDMVGALVLMASAVGGYPMSEATAALAAPIGEAFKAGDFVRGIDLSVRLWVDGPERGPDQVDPAVRERFRALYTDVLRRSRDGAREPEALNPPAYTRLGEIVAPTLVVVGGGDVPDILDQADLLEWSITGARKVVLPRAAHLLNMERPEEVNRILLDFLAKEYPAEQSQS